MLIRRTSSADIPEIAALVRSVVLETYSYLVERHGPPPAGDPARWSEALVATTTDEIVGVGLAQGDFLSDLWVKAKSRNHKVGAAILSALEIQIETGGYALARLRVVAENIRARRFYTAHGWQEVKSYPHERDGHLMVDMEKSF